MIYIYILIWCIPCFSYTICTGHNELNICGHMVNINTNGWTKNIWCTAYFDFTEFWTKTFHRKELMVVCHFSTHRGRVMTHSPPKKVLAQLCIPVLLANPRISTIDVHFLLKGMTCIVNSNSLQWVWKYIIHIHSKKHPFCFNILFIELVFSNSTSHSFKM